MANQNKYNLTSESRTSIYFINFIQGMSISHHYTHSIFQFGKTKTQTQFLHISFYTKSLTKKSQIKFCKLGGVH